MMKSIVDFHKHEMRKVCATIVAVQTKDIF